MIDYAVLKNEIETDPNGLGLTFAKTDKELTDLLNDKTINSDTYTRLELDISDIFAKIDPTELMGLPQRNFDVLNMMGKKNEINVLSPIFLGMVSVLFGASSTTMANMNTFGNTTCKRSEKLFNQDVVYWDIARARGI